MNYAETGMASAKLGAEHEPASAAQLAVWALEEAKARIRWLEEELGRVRVKADAFDTLNRFSLMGQRDYLMAGRGSAGLYVFDEAIDGLKRDMAEPGENLQDLDASDIAEPDYGFAAAPVKINSTIADSDGDDSA